MLRFVVYVQIHHSATLRWRICCIYTTLLRLDGIYLLFDYTTISSDVRHYYTMSKRWSLLCTLY